MVLNVKSGAGFAVRRSSTNTAISRNNTFEYKLRTTSIDISADEYENINVQDKFSTVLRGIPRRDEINLYDIPETLYPTYRQPSIATKIILAIVSAFISIVTTFPTTAILSYKRWWINLVRLFTHTIGQRSITELVSFVVIRKIAVVALKSIVSYMLLSASWQEIFLTPSRISTRDLLSNYNLPSKLSKYQPIEIKLSDIDSKQLNVHWIEYENEKVQTNQIDSRYQTNIVYFNHGFGASSLSWLPAIPKVTELLGARYGLGHDAVGFGFTDRPGKLNDNDNNYLKYYTSDSSAQIAVSLIISRMKEGMDAKRKHANTTGFNSPDMSMVEEQYSVVLFGHSMGAITTLRTALKLREAFKQAVENDRSRLRIKIFLVAPALGFSSLHRKVKKSSNLVGRRIGNLGRRWITNISERTGRYVLARAVGTPSFWRRGLSLAWGDRDRLSDTDVLRYQWPSIGKGWEQGLLNFAKAQTQSLTISKSVADDGRNRDEILLQSVLEMPEVDNVHVILGGQDKVIPPQMVQNFLNKKFPEVSVVVLEGQGHDPFEERVDDFVDTVRCLRSKNRSDPN